MPLSKSSQSEAGVELHAYHISWDCKFTLDLCENTGLIGDC